LSILEREREGGKVIERVGESLKVCEKEREMRVCEREAKRTSPRESKIKGK